MHPLGERSEAPVESGRRVPPVPPGPTPEAVTFAGPVTPKGPSGKSRCLRTRSPRRASWHGCHLDPDLSPWGPPSGRGLSEGAAAAEIPILAVLYASRFESRCGKRPYAHVRAAGWSA